MSRTHPDPSGDAPDAGCAGQVSRRPAPGFPACRSAAQRAPRIPLPTLEWLGSEPFRVFFPLGALASVAGVALWPLFYAGGLGFHPGWAHARLMIHGAMAAYIFGFLGTALPRMLSAPRWGVAEWMILLALWAGACAAHGTGRTAAGDALWLVLVLGFLATMAWRWVRRGESELPPGFLMAVAGLTCGLAGTGLLLAAGSVSLSSSGRRFGELLLYQGFVLLPVLGIGSFLFPRFLAGPASEAGGAATWSRARAVLLAAGLVAGILASFLVEAAGWERAGNAIRLVLAGGYLARTTRVFRRTGTTGTLAFALRCAVGCLLAGLAARAIWPGQRIAVEHVVLVGGFGLLVLTVGCRVVLGHSGRAGLFFQKLRPLRWITLLVLVAMVTRVSADFLPRSLVSHHNYAALLWGVAALWWVGWLGRSLVRRDPDPD